MRELLTAGATSGPCAAAPWPQRPQRVEAGLKLCDVRHTPRDLPRHMVAALEWQGSCLEHYMSDDAKLGLILLFMVFALMVIGPVIAG